MNYDYPKFVKGSIHVPRLSSREYIHFAQYTDKSLLDEAISSIVLRLNPPIDLGNGEILEPSNHSPILTFRTHADGAYFDMANAGRLDDGSILVNIAFVSPHDRDRIEPKDIYSRV